jgi:hypothetical protein
MGAVRFRITSCKCSGWSMPRAARFATVEDSRTAEAMALAGARAGKGECRYLSNKAPKVLIQAF